MPEPVTGHLRLSPGGVVVLDPYFREELPSGPGHGVIELVGRNDRFLMTRAVGLGQTSMTTTQACELYFHNQPKRKGHWLSIVGPVKPAMFEGAAIVERIDRQAPHVLRELGAQLESNSSLQAARCWVGLTFVEEGPSRGEYRRNWVFARVHLNRQGQGGVVTLLRTQALTKSERTRRIPELVGLAGARVLVAGAGSLGAPVTLELARAGVGRIDVIDNDFFDVNNSVRHPLTPQQAARNKADAVADAAREANLFVEVIAHPIQIGAGAVQAGEVFELVAAADVVVDTTGSNAVARILQRDCHEAHTVLVVSGLTAGSYGGEVATFKPDGPCFDCFAQAHGDGSIPQPPEAPPGPGVTPIGCSHPAFSGAGFDAAELAARTARAVVQATGCSTYPPPDFDWAVVNFRGAPAVQTGTLAQHPGCWRHP